MASPFQVLSLAGNAGDAVVAHEDQGPQDTVARSFVDLKDRQFRLRFSLLTSFVTVPKSFESSFSPVNGEQGTG
jgi:hypothetical protein